MDHAYVCEGVCGGVTTYAVGRRGRVFLVSVLGIHLTHSSGRMVITCRGTAERSSTVAPPVPPVTRVSGHAPGVCDVWRLVEPLDGWRNVRVRDRRAAGDWAQQELAFVVAGNEPAPHACPFATAKAATGAVRFAR